ncbi:MAG: tellurium resistance protein TehB [Sulfurovum sp.]|nr:MAG: tellurium resistance protein TehB [Sulfurovum sp.]
MSREDKERWNTKYKEKKAPHEPIKLIRDYAKLDSDNKALDIACGMGRHSKYLASLGFEVDALDISSVAIKALHGVAHIHPLEVDFDTYTLPKNKYNLIVSTYFLNRRLFPQMINALNSNGIILLETFLHDEDNEREPSNPAFLLKKGELEDFFGHKCELLYLEEWWGTDYTGANVMKISMVARKKIS